LENLREVFAVVTTFIDFDTYELPVAVKVKYKRGGGVKK
jgi:hypothetical protein